MTDNQIFNKSKTMNINGRLYDLNKPVIMGIVNLTDDSFYHHSRFDGIDYALDKIEQMLEQGAFFIDIGAQSTRPNASVLKPDDELKRLIPVIEHSVKRFPEIKISVDTFYGQVAKESVKSGACMINDVSAYSIDQQMFKTIIDLNVPYVLMHSGIENGYLHQSSASTDILKDVIKFLADKVQILTMNGQNDIIIDPGFGFGKTIEQNYKLLDSLEHFSYFERPVLVGLSRKSMIYKALEMNPEEALNGTTVLNTIAVLKGADILRVHDVSEAAQVIHLLDLIQA